jgi:uncharacterized protein YbaP (TraB family)
MRDLPRAIARTAALCLALFGVASGAQAQEWATKAFCDPPRIAVFDRVFAPQTRADLERHAARIPNGTGRFWRVTSPDGAVSHLWGTMHSSHPSVLDLPQAVLTEIAGASRVALEIDPTFKDRESHGRFVRGDGLYRPAMSPFRFADLGLPQDIERHLGNRLEALGWPRDSLDTLTFGGLSDLLLSDPCEDFSAGVLPTQDSYIQTLAHIEGTPVLALEPVDRLPRKLNLPENRDLARAIIATYGVYLLPDATTEARATALALYREGRIGLSMVWDTIAVGAALGDEGPALYDRMSRYLVEERNVDFVNAARPALTEGGLFFAVGNFHLPGETGLVALLREGFDVTRVALPGEAP